MDNKGLLFIPDISGFTRFINESEIEHSRYVIQELLEVLINANRIGLEISEIEGDAILFYKFGNAPALEQIYQQVSDMFCAFHRHLTSYDRRRYCQCEACKGAINLSLKVISHYGEFTDYQVQHFRKLIGKDVIVAHQLLKNDIQQHEYWLVTKKLVPDQQPADLTQWMQWASSAKETETGVIPFHYTMLSRLKDQLPPEPAEEPDLSDKIKIISVSKEYETNFIRLFHATGDFNQRDKWLEGVKKVETTGPLLPRVGMKCRYILDNDEAVIKSTSINFNTELIRFSETEEKKHITSLYTLEKTSETTARFTLDIYLKKNIIAQLLFNITGKHKMEQNLQKSLATLEKLLVQMNVPAA